jgi:WD40 repeat protein
VYERIDRILDRFEAAWQRGGQPSLDAYLAEAHAERRLLLRELALLDLEYRLKAGGPVSAADYLTRFPDLAEDSAAAGELIAAEFVLRERCGEAPQIEDYLARFPRYADCLRQRIEARRTRGGAGIEAARRAPAEAVTVSPPAAGPGAEDGAAVPPTELRADGADGEAAAKPESLRVAGYEVLGRLGTGGMGVVYQARQTALRRVVALKMILHGDYADEERRRRFQAEAEAVAQLQHPNIVQVYEVGEHEGLPYFSLEFCAGGSLEKQLDGTPWPPERAASLIETLARAMQAAHQAGLIHRDLKPGNVLLAADGTPKITDFGLVKRLDVPGHTETGAIVGTPSYMAPEQAGSNQQVGPATDVYALGAILYELLTGRPPFKAATALDTVLLLVSEEPVPVRRLQPRVPRDLETICHKCLEKDPVNRYISAEALAEDLRRYCNGEPVRVRAAGVVERLAKWARRKPTLAAAYALAIVVLGLTVLTTGAVWLWRQAVTARNELAVQQQETESARHDAEAAHERERDARQVVARWDYARTVDLAHREFRENQVQRARQMLEDCRPELRGWEWDHVHRLCYGDVMTLREGNRVSQNMAAFSPDGSRIAIVSGMGGISEWEASTGKLLRAVAYQLEERTMHTAFSMAYSPDGAHILMGGQAAALLCDARTGKEVRRFQGAGDWVAISPDGATIATVGGDPWHLDDHEGLILWDGRTGAIRKKLPGIGRSALIALLTSNFLAFNSDGTALAALRFDPLKGKDRKPVVDVVATIWDVKTGTERLTLRAQEGIASVAFSRDGARLITTGWSKKARVWDAATGKVLLTLTGPLAGQWTAAFWTAAFSPDGSLIATAGADHNVRVWDTATGTEIALLVGHTSDVCHVCFSPDGRHILTTGYGDQSVRLWDTPPRGDPQLLWGGWKKDEKPDLQTHPTGLLLWSGPQVNKFALSPDGRRIATINGRRIQVWDAASGAEVRHFELHPEFAFLAASALGMVRSPLAAAALLAIPVRFGLGDDHIRLAWSPDGSRIVTGGPDNAARVWDVATGRVVLVLEGHTGPVGAVAWSPDGTQIATGGNWGDKPGEGGSVVLWDAKTGAPTHTLSCQLQYRNMGTGMTWPVWFQIVDGISFSPDGRRVLAWGNGAVVWDIAAGQALVKAGPDKVEWVRIGPPKAFSAGCFSPDGTRIITAGDDRVARVWDVANGTELLTLKGQADVWSAAYSPDGTRLLTADLRGTAKLWDALTGAEMLTLPDAGYLAVFSPDGKTVITGGRTGGGLKRWDTTPVHRGTFSANAGKADAGGQQPQKADKIGP